MRKSARIGIVAVLAASIAGCADQRGAISTSMNAKSALSARSKVSTTDPGSTDHGSTSDPISTITPTSSPPAGYDQAYQLAGDPNRAGVYYISSDSSDFRLFYVSPGSMLKSWLIQPSPMPVALQSGIAVGPGVVWVGARSELFRVNLNTDLVSAFQLPAVATATDARLPPTLASGDNGVIGVAFLSDGTVLIARNAASNLQTYNSNNGTFGTIAMPSGYVVQDVVADGDFYAASLTDESGTAKIVIGTTGISATGISATKTILAAAPLVTAGSGRFTIGSASAGLESVHLLGSAEERLAGPIPNGSLRLSPGVEAPSLGMGVYAADGGYVYGTMTGLAYNISNGTSKAFILPPFDCSGASLPPQPPGATQEGQPTMDTCASRATSISIDGAGNVWYVSSGPGYKVGFIPADAL